MALCQRCFRFVLNSVSWLLLTDLADLLMLLMARPRVTLSLRKEMPRMAMARGTLSRL